MDHKLKRQLATDELRRAHKTPLPNFQLPLLNALAVVECLDAYLFHCNAAPIVPDQKHREQLAAARAYLAGGLEASRLVARLRAGEIVGAGPRSEVIVFPPTNIFWLYLLTAAVAQGARDIGEASLSACYARVTVNSLAAQLEGSFPNVAELLRDAHDVAKDCPVPADLPTRLVS